MEILLAFSGVVLGAVLTSQILVAVFSAIVRVWK